MINAGGRDFRWAVPGELGYDDSGLESNHVVMARRHIAWLEKELPAWIREGLVSEAGAEALRARYRGDRTEGRNWALTIFGILGGLLIGTGIITILANNWEELGRGARTVVALLPMLAAQSLAVFVFRRNLRSSTAWKEGVAAFWVMALGAALSLIWQTYHLPHEWTQFFMLWALLSLPVVYLMDSLAGMTLYLVAASVWGLSEVTAFGSRATVHFYWMLLAAAVPMAVMRRRAAVESAGTAFVFWLLAAGLCVGTAGSLVALSPGGDELVILAIALVGAVAVGISRSAFQRLSHPWKDPFGIVGGLTIVILALALSFGTPWTSMPDAELGLWIFLGVAAIFWVGCSVPVARAGRPGPAGLLLLAFPVVLTVDLLLSAGGGEVAELIYNGYLLVLGILLICDGARSASLSIANAGLVVVAVHLIVRLFDSDIPFTLKGILFIVVGAGFLGANYAIVKKRREKGSGPRVTPTPSSS